MNESDINKLFMRVAENAGDIPEEVRSVFSILLSSTLHHRDRLKKDIGIILTVEDVRVALDWLLEVMRSGQRPETDNAVRLELLDTWLGVLK